MHRCSCLAAGAFLLLVACNDTEAGYRHAVQCAGVLADRHAGVDWAVRHATSIGRKLGKPEAVVRSDLKATVATEQARLPLSTENPILDDAFSRCANSYT
jgi:hypothetical protein